MYLVRGLVCTYDPEGYAGGSLYSQKGHPSRTGGRGGTRRNRSPGPPGWGLGIGPTTLSCKRHQVTETRNKSKTSYTGSGTRTCRTPNDNYITWDDGSMTDMSQSRKEARMLMRSFANPKQKRRIGCWNVRTMYSIGKTAQIREKAKKYTVNILGIPHLLFLNTKWCHQV